MPDKREPEDWEVTKEDIERERQTLEDNVSKYPSLRLILDKIGDAADPQRAPTTRSQVKFRKLLLEFIKDPTRIDTLSATDVPTNIYAQYVFEEGQLIMDAGELMAHDPGFADWVDNIHDRDLILRDYHGVFQVACEDVNDAYELGIASIRAQGAMANEIEAEIY